MTLTSSAEHAHKTQEVTVRVEVIKQQAQMHTCSLGVSVGGAEDGTQMWPLTIPLTDSMSLHFVWPWLTLCAPQLPHTQTRSTIHGQVWTP